MYCQCNQNNCSSECSIVRLVKVLACEAGPREGSGSQWAFEDVFEDYDLLLEFDKQPKCGPLFNAEKPGALLNAI